MRWWLLAFVLACAGFALSVQQQWLGLPARWNPWAPLDVRDEPSLLTRYKLWRLRDDVDLCRLAFRWQWHR